MSQSPKHSLIESLVNVVVGYGIALASQLLIFPLFGIHISLQDNIVRPAVHRGQHRTQLRATPGV